MKKLLFSLLFVVTSVSAADSITCVYGDVTLIPSGGTVEYYTLTYSAIKNLCLAGKDWTRNAYYNALQIVVAKNKNKPDVEYITNPSSVLKGWGYYPCIDKNNSNVITFPFARWTDKNKRNAMLDWLYCDLSKTPNDVKTTCNNMKYSTCN